MATWLESVNAKDGNPGELVLEELHAVLAIVAAKTTPDEAAAFGRRLLSAAQGAAEAAKEGGFMGCGIRQVSDGAKAMLDGVRKGRDRVMSAASRHVGAID